MDNSIPYKSKKFKVTSNCFYKKRTSDGEQIKTGLINLRTHEYMTRTFIQDRNQRLELSKEKIEGQGHGYDYVGVTDIQLNVEIAKSS